MNYVRHAKIAHEWLDSVEKGRNLLEALQYPTAVDRMTYLFETYPEVKDFKHETLAYLFGMSRETVTRALNSLGIYRSKRRAPEPREVQIYAR
jgi:hypothetical protein